jgi:hypothetical protein
MTQTRIERRRTPRVEPAQESQLALDVSIPVQVIDISLSGVLLASKTELAVGERADLRAAVGARSVNVEIEIRRVFVDVNPPRGGVRFKAGAVFAPMSAEQRVMLEELLGAEPS